MAYLNIDDILAEEELVPVLFRTAVNGVGILDPGSEDNNIARGATIDLPFWLAEDLFYSKGALINLPNFYRQTTRKEMQADPACVDLRSKCMYFYELGCKLIPVVPDPTLGTFLLSAFRGRYKHMLCKCYGGAMMALPQFTQLLTKEEMQMFKAGRESMGAYQKWRAQGTQLERASILGRKRRLGLSM